MTNKEDSDEDRELTWNRLALHTYELCVCVHGCTCECVSFGKCVLACDLRVECGKKEKEENRRASRKVRILMSRYEGKLNLRLLQEIMSRSAKETKAELQTAKDTAQGI